MIGLRLASFSAILIAGIAAAAAAPRASTGNNPARRQAGNGEVIFLVNCQGSATQSQMNYYVNGLFSSGGGEQPDAVADVGYDSWVLWEGQPVTGQFPNGTMATTYISANGAQVGDYNFAGNASTSDGHHYHCYKDDKREFHTGVSGPGFVCYSLYYCESAKTCGPPQLQF